MKRLFISTPSEPRKDPASDWLIDRSWDSPELIEFTEKTIRDIEENGLTFEKIESMYTEFDKSDDFDTGLAPVFKVSESEDEVKVRWADGCEATFTLE